MMKTIHVKLNKTDAAFEKKQSVIDYLRAHTAEFGDPHAYIACSVNNRIRELATKIDRPCDIELLTLRDQNAIKVYETSLRFLLVMAADRAFPGRPVKLSYHMARSIFVNFSTEPNEYFDEEKMAKLQTEMDRIVAADLPIVREVQTKSEAEAYYRAHGMEDKIALLQYRPEKTVHQNLCDGYLNYLYGHNVPSTGHVAKYRLSLFEGGVLAQYPRSECGGEIPPFQVDKVYAETLDKSYRKSKLMGTESIAAINKRVENDGPVDFVNLCESYHNAMFAELGERIFDRRDTVRLICVAGPSSSGKTTFSNRLRTELMARGMSPLRISLDDYYVDREKTPRDEAGEYDYECLEALQIDRFNDDMNRLIAGEKVTLPRYDFTIGKSVEGRTLTLGKGEPIIVEGIHALNRQMTSGIPKNGKFNIFIAPAAQINFDNHTPISLTDLRLCRRIVRDNQFRATPATDTIDRWPSVRRGEFRWIYDTQENADFVFNSLLPYEPCVLKKVALPLLLAIPQEAPEYPLANRLVKFLKLFCDMEDTWVPCNSILREFLGGSCFADV